VSAPPAIDLDGVRVHAIDEAQCLALVGAALCAGRGGWILTPNLDHLRMLQDDVPMRACYREADLVVADGMPLVWASRLQCTPLPGRVAGSDLIWSLSGLAAAAGRSVYLLGGDPGTAEDSAARLRERHPGLVVAGTFCPVPGFERRPGGVEDVVARLVAARPDVVFVALGTPKQELLIGRMRSCLPAAWWMGVGISFSFVAGRVRRAPPWVRALGVEWLHRLFQEPGKLAGRYLVRDLPYAAALFTRTAGRGLSGRPGRRGPA
jgi:N-acetylglucosaminyldiphosphoundecaprenol N-acetyl-beta-D-mannosaminyltransferase